MSSETVEEKIIKNMDNGMNSKCISFGVVCFYFKTSKSEVAKTFSLKTIERLRYWIEANILFDKERKNIKDLLERLDKDMEQLTMFESNQVDIFFHDPLENQNIVLALQKLKEQHAI